MVMAGRVETTPITLFAFVARATVVPHTVMTISLGARSSAEEYISAMSLPPVTCAFFAWIVPVDVALGEQYPSESMQRLPLTMASPAGTYPLPMTTIFLKPGNWPSVAGLIAWPLAIPCVDVAVKKDRKSVV